MRRRKALLEGKWRGEVAGPSVSKKGDTGMYLPKVLFT